MGDSEMKSENELPRDSLPSDVYAEHADYVRVAFKAPVAARIVGWLRTYAKYADIAGNTSSSEAARSVAGRLAHELGEDE